MDEDYEDDFDTEGSGGGFALGFGEPSDDRMWTPKTRDVSVEDPEGRDWLPSGVHPSPLNLPQPLAYLSPIAIVVTDTEPVSISFKFPGAEPFTIAVDSSDYPALALAFTQCIAFAQSQSIGLPVSTVEPFRES